MPICKWITCGSTADLMRSSSRSGDVRPTRADNLANQQAATSAASDFSEYIGRSETVRGRIVAQSMELLAAALNRNFDDISPTGALPPLWHLLILQKPAPQSELGPDGHPKRGGLIPPIPYPRRMFAGSRVQFIAPLYVGEEVQRTTTIKSVIPKAGRTGNLVFVSLEQVFRGPNGVAIIDEQDLVFRENDGPKTDVPRAQADRGRPSGFVAVETVYPDPVLLFRYSAAAGISHRIHYDLEYVKTVEGYPNLIVHGPLQAVLLADLAVRHLGRSLRSFEFRMLKPAFVDTPLYCVVSESTGKTSFQTLDPIHDVCTSAQAN
jgi:3-methylfumaryl-CoA hydratase